MADSQFNPLGSVAAPADWTLPPSLNLQLKNVYASFDGTSAAGSFVPCLQIVSDSGHTVGSYPCASTVAAGGSADVTWFPRVAGSSAQAVFQAPFAALRISAAQTVTGANTIQHLDMDGSFETSDTSVFAQAPVPTIFGTPNGLECIVNGTYLIWINYLTFGGTAGSTLTTYFTGIHGDLSVWQAGRSGALIGDTWDAGAPSDGGSPPYVHTSFAFLYGLRKGALAPAPGYISPYGRLSAGADVTIDAQMWAFYLGPFADVGL